MFIYIHNANQYEPC